MFDENVAEEGVVDLDMIIYKTKTKTKTRTNLTERKSEQKETYQKSPRVYLLEVKSQSILHCLLKAGQAGHHLA